MQDGKEKNWNLPYYKCARWNEVEKTHLILVFTHLFFYYFFLFSFIILNFSDVLFSHSLHLSILYNVFNIFYWNISLQLVSVVDRYENIYFGHIWK